MSESQRELYSGVVTVHWDEQSTTHTRELIRVIIRDPLLLSLNLDSAHTHKAKQSVCLPVAVKCVRRRRLRSITMEWPLFQHPTMQCIHTGHKFGTLSASPFSNSSPSRQANETHCHLRREEGRINIARIITVIVIIVRI